MLGFLMTENQVLTGTDQCYCQCYCCDTKFVRSRKLTVGKKTCVLFNSKLLISLVSSSCLLSAQEIKKQKADDHLTEMHCSPCCQVCRGRSLHPFPLLLFQQQLCQMLHYFWATLYGYFPVVSCTAHHRVRKVTLFFWEGFLRRILM